MFLLGSNSLISGSERNFPCSAQRPRGKIFGGSKKICAQFEHLQGLFLREWNATADRTWARVLFKVPPPLKGSANFPTLCHYVLLCGRHFIRQILSQDEDDHDSERRSIHLAAIQMKRPDNWVGGNYFRTNCIIKRQYCVAMAADGDGSCRYTHWKIKNNLLTFVLFLLLPTNHPRAGNCCQLLLNKFNFATSFNRLLLLFWCWWWWWKTGIIDPH